MLVFLDLEMTGLKPEKHTILEVGTVLTSDDLVILDQESWVVKQEVNLDELDPVVVDMHTRNGLWEEVKEGNAQSAVEADVTAWLDQRVRNPPWTMAGNSVYFDRGFLRRHMPRLEERFHYRLVDVSSFKLMMRRWFPKEYYSREEPAPAHRALQDCLGSIEELKYYREILVGT